MAQGDLLKVRFVRTHKSPDGASIAAGTKVELPAAEARKLITAGIAAPASEPKPKSKSE